MSAIDILFQSHSVDFFINYFDISILFLCYLYEKCIVSLPGLQLILFLVLNKMLTIKIWVFIVYRTSKGSLSSKINAEVGEDEVLHLHIYVFQIGYPQVVYNISDSTPLTWRIIHGMAVTK